MGNFCEVCDDGDGGCAFPYFGLAPHTHESGPSVLGSTKFLPEAELPDNFRPDPEWPGMGIYTKCPKCGQRD